MELTTEELEKLFEKYPLYSQEKKDIDAEVIIQCFCPSCYAFLFIIEGEKQDNGDWLFIGFAYEPYWNSGWKSITLKDLENCNATNIGTETPNKNITIRSCLEDLGVTIE